MEPELLANAVTRLETLILRSTELTAEQITAILGAVSEGSRLRHLDISYNWNGMSTVEPGLFVSAVIRLKTLDIVATRLSPEQAETIFAEAQRSSCLVKYR